MEFLSSRYRYTVDQGTSAISALRGTDQSDKISGCNIAGGNVALATAYTKLGIRRGPSARRDQAVLRNVRPCHVSALTWTTFSRPNTRPRFMTPVCWRCFSRPTALFHGIPALLPPVSAVSTQLLDVARCNMLVKSIRCRCFRHVASGSCGEILRREWFPVSFFPYSVCSLIKYNII